MDVRVTIDGDFALTEVDQSFFNPSSETVEGIYGFRTPERAILQRFGVDREGVVVWGRVKEKAAAAAQYQANVYQGSTEDPALLEWDAPGVYRARLYPIGPGETRRVVVRYAEWLDRTGAGRRAAPVRVSDGRRRARRQPAARRRAESHVRPLASRRARRAGRHGGRAAAAIRWWCARTISCRAPIFRSSCSTRASASSGPTARRTRSISRRWPPERPPVRRLSKAEGEADYLLVPIRPGDGKVADGRPRSGDRDRRFGGDRSGHACRSRAPRRRRCLSHLGEQDRAVVLAGDDGLRPIVPGFEQAVEDRRGDAPAGAGRALRRGARRRDRSGRHAGGRGARARSGAALGGRLHRRRRADRRRAVAGLAARAPGQAAGAGARVRARRGRQRPARHLGGACAGRLRRAHLRRLPGRARRAARARSRPSDPSGSAPRSTWGRAWSACSRAKPARWFRARRCGWSGRLAPGQGARAPQDLGPGRSERRAARRSSASTTTAISAGAGPKRASRKCSKTAKAARRWSIWA